MTAPCESVDELVRLHQGLVRAIAWRIQRRSRAWVELDDLVAYGQIGLLEAIRTYDAAKGTSLATFAWHRVRGAILDGLGRMAWFDRGSFERGGFEMNAPADAADGDAAEAPGREAPRGRRFACREPMDAAAVVGHAPAADEAAMHRELILFLRDLVAHLPDREAALIRGMFFEGRTLTEAARRVGISTAWASRLQTRTLADLRIALERGGFR